MILTWTSGLLRRRWGRLTAAAAGIAAAVALVACLGSFLAAAQGSMTARALRSVAVDWQVEVQPGSPPAAILDTVRSSPGVGAALPVGFAHSAGLVAQTTGSTQTTGPAMVLGIPTEYRTHFPGELRTLVGADDGVLLAQQTAANLHVVPGDTVRIGRAGLTPVEVRVDGVVDLPQADSLFQKVGAPVGAAPVAPPDNVLILGEAQWHRIFDPLSEVRPDLVSTQIHTAVDHALSADPGAAYTAVTAAARNLEARSVGGAQVGDNLGAALGAARSDAAYARMLFLFLGLPAAVLAGLLTAAVVTAGAGQRRRDQALLRARGATRRQLGRIAVAEAAVVGVVGSVVGLPAAALIGVAMFGSAGLGAGAATTAAWAAASALVGFGISAAAVLAPAWRDLNDSTVVGARAEVIRSRAPKWTRSGIDVAALAVSGALFWQAGRNGYQIVLAPEGVPTISVSYWAFVAPALLWIGMALLVWRLSDLLLGRGWTVLAVALRPIAGRMSRIVARSLSRQRAPLARSAVLVALALAFATSTATFNATYQAQVEVDAKLTNGADVTVTEPPGSSIPPSAGAELAGIPGVRAVEPLQHRFAYVGTDLQDLYGVDPTTIGSVTALQDNYFQGGTAAELMHTLARQPDSLLVSAETVKDFQLMPGDNVNLRIQDARTHQLISVPFRYVGIVTEFPTAPKDSFFVANAGYIAERTGSDAVGAFLVDTGGHASTAVADRIRTALGTSATVSDIATTRGTVGSSLTAVSLAGLTRIELGFGLLLAAASGALVLGLGLADRRRSFAIANALGANRRQLRSFVVAEAAILITCGLAGGAALGWLLSRMLVSVLTGVFDPPPAALSVPWVYLGAAGAMAVLAISAVSAATVGLARRSPLTVLSEL
ncbi:MAG TPA: ABC transporter permease [Mycobacterium sp.]|nr:ABC transporter permease [Mycobacterium sp.]HPX38546.1 ABC transporter permease [Mycobacterium sp.]HPZ96164.1 ABC transporter permease [Mycobacterium sp.]HQC77647.1 ABC transporter permease [Mycobacterium sp.]HQE14778.1 ABC transporter permease [Mycobacterium sp.]